jgi:hypothetical protein
MIRKTEPKPYPTEHEVRGAAVQRAEEFSGLTGMTLTAIGKRAVRDDHAIFDMRDGKNFTIGKWARLMKWFDDNWPRGEAKRAARAAQQPPS